MFLKADTVGIKQVAGYRMGDHESVEELEWMAYIGQMTNNITHSGNGREFHLPTVPKVKGDGYCAETREVFDYLECFWHGFQCMHNRHTSICNTEDIILCWHEETKAK